MERDKYDKDVLKQLTKIANSLEDIRRVLAVEQVEKSKNESEMEPKNENAFVTGYEAAIR